MNKKTNKSDIFDIVKHDNQEVNMEHNKNEYCSEQAEQKRKGHACRPVLFLVVMAALIAGFILVHSWTPKTGSIGAHFVSPGRIKPETPAKTYDTTALRQQINRLTMDYQEDCNRLLAQYMDLLETNINPEYNQAKDAIPRVVDDLSSFSACVKLSYKAAKDSLKDTHDFDDALMEVIDGPIVQPCLRANHVANEMLRNLNQQLKERYARYAMDLAEVCSESGENADIPQQDLSRLLECITTTAASTKELQTEKLFAAVSVVVEAVVFRQTCSAIVKLFAKPVATICSSLGIGGICAAADGPLPVCDIIGGVLAVGGLVWTAYDVYDVTCVMPGELRSELSNGIDETRTKLLEESRAKVREMVNTYQEIGGTLQAQLDNEIN